MPAAAIDITSALQNSLSMPRPERSYLAERLLVSLEDDDEMPPQWSEEMDARVQRRERGVTRSYSHEEVMAELDSRSVWERDFLPELARHHDSVHHEWGPVSGWIYLPHPDTKPGHFQKPDVLELLLPWTEGLEYGTRLELEAPEGQMVFV